MLLKTLPALNSDSLLKKGLCVEQALKKHLPDISNLRGVKWFTTITLFFFFFYKNVVFPAQAEYSYFSADFMLKIFLYYS